MEGIMYRTYVNDGKSLTRNCEKFLGLRETKSVLGLNENYWVKFTQHSYYFIKY